MISLGHFQEPVRLCLLTVFASSSRCERAWLWCGVITEGSSSVGESGRRRSRRLLRSEIVSTNICGTHETSARICEVPPDGSCSFDVVVWTCLDLSRDNDC